jgi:hypothetical protein
MLFVHRATLTSLQLLKAVEPINEFLALWNLRFRKRHHGTFQTVQQNGLRVFLGCQATKALAFAVVLLTAV